LETSCGEGFLPGDRERGEGEEGEEYKP